MEYLVESHMGSFYYVSDETPKEITKTNPETGDSDTILLSWKNGRKLEVLEEYFSGVRKNQASIRNLYKKGLSKETVYEIVNYHYNEDELMIAELLKSNIIDENEAKHLLKVNKEYREKQIEVFNNTKVLKLKNK